MKDFLRDEETLQKCKIYAMLDEHSQKPHFSFHTPGHKIAKWDLTELSFSDNLCAPTGCIAEAERDIAALLGANKSFILTDGSTAGVLSMLYAAKQSGVKTLVLSQNSHKSAFNGCALMGITPLIYEEREEEGIPKPLTATELAPYLSQADGILLTSPNYYGRVADLKSIRALCDESGKRLLVDGAHGGHLRFHKEYYAGAYADIWVDGVHKSLPAFTQGAVVSAKNERYAEALFKGVNIFRTTSPSYPIMASVEYAVKYPRNEWLENAVRAVHQERVRVFEDWTKVVALFGETAFEAEKEAEALGVYPEFCDGNVLTFYLSPATEKEDWTVLVKTLERLFEKYPYVPKKSVHLNHTPLFLDENTQTEWVDLEKSIGKICAYGCGMFPPCTPLILSGEPITGEKIRLLKNAVNAYGLLNGKIAIIKEEKRK